jgi:HPt (histidine-containing phosphotransfer) domain-containing protein
MDVQMPVLDGHDATRRIRLELGLTKLPIIALTAGALSSERQRAAAAGMYFFIIKPFSAEDLVRTILRHVKRAKGQPAPRIAGAPGTLLPPVKPWPEIEGIDSIDARARFGDDVALFGSMLKRLLHEFADVSIPVVAEGPAALAAHGGRMHKLRGAAGMLGAKAIQDLAAEAEAACAAGEVEHGARLATSLAAQLQRLRDDATPKLSGPGGAGEGAGPSTDEALEATAIVDLVGLLRQQNLAAADRFSAITPQLQRCLGQESYALVSDHISNLRFTDAAKLLEQVRHLPPTPALV